MFKTENLNCACKNKNYTVKRPKKMVLSKKSAPDVKTTASDGKSSSTGKVGKKYTESLKNSTTKSEFSVSTKGAKSEKVNFKDLFVKCGDNLDTQNQNKENNPCIQPKPSSSADSIKKKQSRVTVPSQKVLTNIIKGDSGATSKSEPIKQYYRNKNYKDTESVRHIPKKIGNLDPIKESSENRSCVSGSDHTSSEEITVSSKSDVMSYIDVDNPEVVEKIKTFRNENYFECHSARARIEDKVPVTNIINHKCAYRFYLNDRLFPVPVTYDRNNTIRCVECNLPFTGNKNVNSEKFLNGTIQCKIQVGNDSQVQDLTILLPVKENLIIKQKRLELKRNDETVYFGVIKLSEIGGTFVDKGVEEESLALRHQKGFKEYENVEEYTYKCVNENEVVYV